MPPPTAFDDADASRSDIDVTAPLLTATRALCESILAAMKAALHRIVHTACTDDDLLPSLSRGFTRSLFVLFGSTSATLALASKLGITGRDPLSFLTVRLASLQIAGLLTQLVL